MHVEPPHGPIRSIREFLIQIFTITVGLLIALGLEGIVARYHEYRQVEEARRNLQAELTEIKSKIIIGLGALNETGKTLDRLIAFGQALAKDRHTPAPKDDLSFTFVVLPSTNWDAAVATGAIALMPYREVRYYAAAYQGERPYMQIEQDAQRTSFELTGFVGDYAAMSDSQIEQGERELRMSAGYVATLKSNGVALLQTIEKALNAKPQ